MGPSPSIRLRHTMASDGTRIFVLGGKPSATAPGEESALIDVLNTSAYFLFVISFGLPPSLKSQSTSSTQISTLSLSSPVGRPPDAHGSHYRVLRPRSNHNTRSPLHWMLTRRTVLLLFKRPLPKNWVALPFRRLLASKTPACHRNPRV
jgi:hypothetical protein